jgi:hypothetical protein
MSNIPEVGSREQWTPTAWFLELPTLTLLAGYHIQPSGLLTISVLIADKLCQRAQYKYMGSTGKLPAKCDKGTLSTSTNIWKSGMKLSYP